MGGALVFVVKRLNDDDVKGIENRMAFPHVAGQKLFDAPGVGGGTVGITRVETVSNPRQQRAGGFLAIAGLQVALRGGFHMVDGQSVAASGVEDVGGIVVPVGE